MKEQRAHWLRSDWVKQLVLIGFGFVLGYGLAYFEMYLAAWDEIDRPITQQEMNELGL